MPVEGQEYGTFDPIAVRPDPVPEEATPPTSTELLDDNGIPLPVFDRRYEEDFEGLIYLGALTNSFTWLGHGFVIRTLTQGELLIVALLIKKWAGTLGEQKAYVTALAALATMSVDGKSLPTPVGDGDGEFAWAYQRFNYAQMNWFQFTIDKIYSEYLALEAKANAVIDAMEKASGPVGSTAGSNATSAGPNDRDF